MGDETGAELEGSDDQQVDDEDPFSTESILVKSPDNVDESM